ncbi:MAG TPA: tyrosine-type recombinase/integrase [Noviherbaspirillum sp.]|nr:tyrosine-type recombinase/integrase [Noviherbaspirillum sp.]
MYLKHGAYRFYSPEPIRDKDGKLKRWITLAYEYEGESTMLTALGALLGSKRTEQGSMPYVCAEFKANKLNKYGKDTQAQYAQYLDVISDVFEEFHAADVTTKECADFLRAKFKGKPNTAQKYAALMKRLFKFVISELGIRQDNPVDQLDLSDYETKRREILPTHEQVAAIREAGMYSKARKDTGKQLPTASGPMFACIIDMTYLCWARAVDVRTLKESQIENGQIRFKPSKTTKSSGKAIDILITPEIQAVIDAARTIKKQYKVKGNDLITPYLFPTQKGGAYTKSGLFSMWDRARDRLGIDKDSPPDLRIQFKDLRALGATDAARAGEQKDEIRKRLVHTTSKTSEIYIKDVIPESSSINMKLPWGRGK